MPVFNELSTVERAIDDALETELPVESRQLVLIDDGSTDGTRELLPAATGRENVRRPPRTQPRQGRGASDRPPARDGRARRRSSTPTSSTARRTSPRARAARRRRRERRLRHPLWSSHSAFSFWYVIGNKGVTFATNVIYNCWISDVMTCHKAMRTELFRSLQPPRAGLRDRAGDRGPRPPRGRADLRGADHVPGALARGGQEAHRPRRAPRAQDARSLPRRLSASRVGTRASPRVARAEALAGALASGPRRRAERAAPRSPSSARSPPQRSRRRPGATSRPVTPSSTASTRPPDARSPRPGGRAPSPRARPCRSPRAATGRHTTAARSYQAPSSRGGTKPTACGNSERSGPSPTTTSGRPSAASASSRTPFSSRESTDVEDVRRLVRLDDGLAGSTTPLGITRTSPAPSARGLVGERRRRADDDPGAPQQPPRERTHAPRERDVRAPELEHDRLARGEGRQMRSAASGRGRRPRRGSPGAQRSRTTRGRAAAARSFQGARRRLLTIPSP